MKKTVLEIYALAVCFVTLGCFVVSLGVCLYSSIQIIKPGFTISSWAFQKYRTNDDYWALLIEKRGCSGKENNNEITNTRPSETELTKQRLAATKGVLDEESREGAQNLVKSMIIVLIDIVAFYVHWVIARRSRTTVTVEPSH